MKRKKNHNGILKQAQQKRTPRTTTENYSNPTNQSNNMNTGRMTDTHKGIKTRHLSDLITLSLHLSENLITSL